MVKCQCSKGSYYKLAVSQVFRILSNITKPNSLISVGIQRWETRRSIRGKLLSGYHLLCSYTLLPGHSLTCYLGVWLAVALVLVTSPEISGMPLTSGSSAHSARLFFFFLYALYLWIVSYASKREFSFYLLNYPYIMNELVHNNFFLIREG